MFSRVPHPELFDEAQRLRAQIRELQDLCDQAAKILESDEMMTLDANGKDIVCPRRIGRWLGKYDVLCGPED